MSVYITMKTNKPGSPDGMRVEMYKAGQTYEVTPALARSFVEVMGVADYAEAPGPVRVRTAGPAPENKSMGAAPSNKGGNPEDDMDLKATRLHALADELGVKSGQIVSFLEDLEKEKGTQFYPMSVLSGKQVEIVRKAFDGKE